MQQVRIRRTLRSWLLPVLLPAVLLASAPWAAAQQAEPTVVAPKLVSWGSNAQGRLGDNATATNTSSALPVNVFSGGALAGKTVTAVSSGTNAQHSCVIASGKAYCWGQALQGQLGNGQSGAGAFSAQPVAVCTTADTAAPCSGTSQLPATATVSDISVGGSVSCAIANGLAYCWGTQTSGRLGNGQTATGSLATPVAVITSGTPLAGKTLTRITVGGNAACALTSEGAAACWGFNKTSTSPQYTGLLGTGSNSFSSSATALALANGEIPAGTAITEIRAGANNSCVIAGGKAYCWGSAAAMALGQSAQSDQPSPIAVCNSASTTPPCAASTGLPSSATVTNLAVAVSTGCAVADGAVYCWGGASTSVGGNSIYPKRLEAGALAGKTVTQVGANGYLLTAAVPGFACYLISDGSLACSGIRAASGSGFGYLGDGDSGTSGTTTPVLVSTGPGSALNGFSVRQVGVHATHTVALTRSSPATPTALVATPDAGSVSIAFTAPADDGGSAITNYQYSTDNGQSFTSLSPADSSSPVVISGLANGTAYQIKLRAQNAIGISPDSAAVSATPVSAEAPGACGPAAMTATASAPSANLCASGEAGMVSSTGGQWAWMCNGTGGNTTSESCAAPFQTQSIMLSAEATDIFVTGTASLSANNNRGLASTVSTDSSACTLGAPSASNPVSVVATGAAAGTCTVKASRAASADGCTSCYQAAAEQTVDITVSRKAQSISGFAPSANSILVGDTATVSASSSSGLAVGFSSVSPTVCSVSGNTVTGIGAGQCQLRANQAGNAEFDVADEAQTALIVTAPPINGLCGSAKTEAATATIPGGASLCEAGAASQVVGGNGRWSWQCNGTNGGSSDNSCAAPYGTQTLSLSALPIGIEVGQTSMVLASSSANLPVTLATGSSTCTLNGTTVTGAAEGACVVTASQAGTGDSGMQRYVAAASVNTTITVTPSLASSCDAYLNRPNVNVIDLRASPGGQTVRGNTSRFNVIYGSRFVDTITGGNAGNCIDGGEGADRITAGSGENWLYGDDGNDTLTPGGSSTAMDGGAGSDRCGRASGRATATYQSCESN